MTFLTLDFSYDNPLFAPFADLVAPEGKTSLDLRLEHFPATYANGFSAMYKALTGAVLEAEATIFKLVFKPGRAPKLYGPAIYKQNDRLVCRWGNAIIELNLGKGCLMPVNGDIDQDLISANIDSVKIGKYQESVINIALEEYEGFEELVMPFPIKPIDWQEGFDLVKGKQLLKKGDVGLISLFAELRTEHSKNSANSIVYGNDVLPQGVDLQVIDARACSTLHGISYILTVAANAEVGLEADVQVWAFSKIRKKLEQGAMVSKEAPGLLNFTKSLNAAGETRYKIRFDANWPESEGTMSLSSILATWN